MQKNRKNGRNNRGKVRGPNPHTGHRRNRITQNAGLSVSGAVDKEKTDNGYVGELFSGKDYGVQYVLLSAGNRTDFGVNEKKDRTVHVLAGSVFVITETAEGVRANERLMRGAHVNFPRGTKYALSTSTENAELLMVSSAGYDKAWQKLEDGVYNPKDVVFTSPVTAETIQAQPQRLRRERQSNPESVPVRRERVSRRRQQAGDVNATSAVGVNPMPSIPSEE